MLVITRVGAWEILVRHIAKLDPSTCRAFLLDGHFPILIAQARFSLALTQFHYPVLHLAKIDFRNRRKSIFVKREHLKLLITGVGRLGECEKGITKGVFRTVVFVTKWERLFFGPPLMEFPTQVSEPVSA